jgi:hypothetical protein
LWWALDAVARGAGFALKNSVGLIMIRRRVKNFQLLWSIIQIAVRQRLDLKRMIIVVGGIIVIVTSGGTKRSVTNN